MSGAVWEYSATELYNDSHIGSMPQLGARCSGQMMCGPGGLPGAPNKEQGTKQRVGK